MAALQTCKRYLLACGQCEGKVVIAAINQMWTEERLSDLLELFCTEEVEKCSCGVIAGLAGYWQRWVTREYRTSSPAPKNYYCGPHFQHDKIASSPEKYAPSSWGTTVNKHSLSLALLFSSL